MGNFGGQEIIQSPAGTINQANTAQLLVVLIIAIACFVITVRQCVENKNIIGNKKITFIIILVSIIFTLLFFKICALLPAIVL